MSKNPHAVALGRLGGFKGGPARKAALSDVERREIARAAAEARWGDHCSCGHTHRVHANSDGKCLFTGCTCRGE